ncbi:MAG: hypothetical protein ACLR23_11890 [Clostridia bacterium]
MRPGLRDIFQDSRGCPLFRGGMFHKDPSIVKNWEQYGNEYYAKIQGGDPGQCGCNVSPGGMLLYSTCTFSPLEDEQTVQNFCSGTGSISLWRSRNVEGWPTGGRSGSLRGLRAASVRQILAPPSAGRRPFCCPLSEGRNGVAVER